GRNLIVCIDGTSNQFGPNNTNIVELYSRIIKDDSQLPQLTYYNSGIGTYAKPSWRSFSHLKQVIDNKIDLAIAWNFEKVLLGAYRWLSDNYDPGDKIFLFGFSRGAYQVRSLAGMISEVGLIRRGNEEQIPFAFELYAGADALTAPFKDTFSWPNGRVHFVGAWDTVSSVGIIRGKSMPGTDTFNDYVCYFRHALALDERRVKFLPEYIRGGDTVHGGSGVESGRSRPRIKEVWFAGCHSDMNTELNNATIPLLWMGVEAELAGLKLTPPKVKRWVRERKTTESLSLGWWPFEILPFKRLSYKNAKGATWYS
ncbi:hypothetical protein JAAARDRAFT_135184, partial [Jaapia argillacea MUCL 33604]